MRPLLIIGQAPNRAGAGRDQAFVGSASGRRLERLLGLQPGTLSCVADAVNLVSEYLGPAGRSGDAFDRRRAAEAAASLDLSGRKLILACGRAVAQALGWGKVPVLEATRVGEVTVLVIPHPSGASRWWNSKENRRRVAATLLAADVERGGLFEGGGE